MKRDYCDYDFHVTFSNKHDDFRSKLIGKYFLYKDLNEDEICIAETIIKLRENVTVCNTNDPGLFKVTTISLTSQTLVSRHCMVMVDC